MSNSAVSAGQRLAPERMSIGILHWGLVDFDGGELELVGLNRTILGVCTGSGQGAKGAKVTGQSFHLGYSSVECVCVCNSLFERRCGLASRNP